MPTESPKASAKAGPKEKPGRRELTPAAERALAEAAARRAKATETAAPSREVGGRGGLEPTRYGDWEINGLISDF